MLRMWKTSYESSSRGEPSFLRCFFAKYRIVQKEAHRFTDSVAHSKKFARVEFKGSPIEMTFVKYRIYNKDAHGFTDQLARPEKYIVFYYSIYDIIYNTRNVFCTQC